MCLKKTTALNKSVSRRRRRRRLRRREEERRTTTTTRLFAALLLLLTNTHAHTKKLDDDEDDDDFDDARFSKRHHLLPTVVLVASKATKKRSSSIQSRRRLARDDDDDDERVDVFVESVEAATTPVVNDRATTTTTLDNGSSKESFMVSKESTIGNPTRRIERWRQSRSCFQARTIAARTFSRTHFNRENSRRYQTGSNRSQKSRKRLVFRSKSSSRDGLKTQKQTVFEQLRTGARYLDLRCGWQGRGGGGGGGDKQGTWKIHHALVGVDVSIVLEDVANFLRTFTTEVVIVEMSHFYFTRTNAR